MFHNKLTPNVNKPKIYEKCSSYRVKMFAIFTVTIYFPKNVWLAFVVWFYALGSKIGWSMLNYSESHLCKLCNFLGHLKMHVLWNLHVAVWCCWQSSILSTLKMVIGHFGTGRHLGLIWGTASDFLTSPQALKAFNLYFGSNIICVKWLSVIIGSIFQLVKPDLAYKCYFYRDNNP